MSNELVPDRNRGARGAILQPGNSAPGRGHPHEPQLALPGFPASSAQEAFRRKLEGILVGNHRLMRELRDRIIRLALLDLPVLIEGESGTGKGLAARAIHEGSCRSHRGMVVANLSGMRDTARSECFGHVKGAYTSAWCDHDGYFAQANGSTLFLDDIPDAPLDVQPVLLRAIEEQRFRPMGAVSEVEVDTRIIAATNQSLDHAVKAGRFRQDLYFRLKVHRLTLPPLRAHLEDLELLTSHFLARAAGPGGTPKNLDPAAMDLLHRHPWEGNVRELENLLIAAAAELEGTCLTADYLQAHLEPSGIQSAAWVQPIPPPRLEAPGVLTVLAECRGNKRETARRLRISPRRLYSLLKSEQAQKGIK